LRLQLRSLAARYAHTPADSTPALGPLDLDVASGEQLAVIGASGAGKTSLLQVLALAMPPSAGALQVDGLDPWQLPRRRLQRLRGRLFLAPQVPPLPPRQRVVTSVLAGRLPALSLWASLRSLVYPSDMPAAHAALQRFALADKLFERVDRLSGGERQRVGLARALLAPARLWLVDEPLSALDPARAGQAMQALVDGAQERGVTLVATLHQVDMALSHFPRIVGLRQGRVMFDLPTAQVTRGRLEQLYAQHEDELDAAALVPALGPDATAAPLAASHCR
jgi:phosphonate transport system ATP-binding protein